MDIGTLIVQGAIALITIFSLTMTIIEAVRITIERRKPKKAPPKESYSEKLARLTVDLTKASQGVDNIVVELSQVARERTESIAKLEAEIARLDAAEKERQARIKALDSIPLPAVDYLLRRMEPSEKKSARRDYLLFGAGAVVGIIGNIVVGIFFTTAGDWALIKQRRHRQVVQRP